LLPSLGSLLNSVGLVTDLVSLMEGSDFEWIAVDGFESNSCQWSSIVVRLEICCWYFLWVWSIEFVVDWAYGFLDSWGLL